MELPEEIRKQIETYCKFISDENSRVLTMAGCQFGYTLASKALSDAEQRLKNQEQTISEFQDGLVKLFGLEKNTTSFFSNFKEQYEKIQSDALKENERLKGLIDKAMTTGIEISGREDWRERVVMVEQFKTENNL